MTNLQFQRFIYRIANLCWDDPNKRHNKDLSSSKTPAGISCMQTCQVCPQSPENQNAPESSRLPGPGYPAHPDSKEKPSLARAGRSGLKAQGLNLSALDLNLRHQHTFKLPGMLGSRAHPGRYTPLRFAGISLRSKLYRLSLAVHPLLRACLAGHIE